MNWLDSSSFTGLLNQAQKSIDKVLDIPREDDSEDKKSGWNLDAGQSQKTPETQGEKRPEQKSSSSWLSGADSFWGSFTQNVSVSPKKDTSHSTEKSFYLEKKNTKTTVKSNDPQKKNSNDSQTESKPSSKAMNLKRNSKKKSPKKKVLTADSHLNDVTATNSKLDDHKRSTVDHLDSTEIEASVNIKDADSADGKTPNVIKKGALFTEVTKPSNGDLLMRKSNNILDENGKTGINENGNKKEFVAIPKEMDIRIENNDDRLMIKNAKDLRHKETEVENLEFEAEIIKQTELVEPVVKLEPEKLDVSEKTPENALENVDLDNNEGVSFNETLQQIDLDGEGELCKNVNEDFLLNAQPKEQKQEHEIDADSVENVNFASSAPLAASTPQRRDPVLYNNDSESRVSPPVNPDDQLDLAKDDEFSEKQSNEQQVSLVLVSDLAAGNDLGSITVANKGDNPGDELEKKEEETTKLRQIIEVRESKLFDLSKENLNLQETNAILRSQIEQLEDMHRSEDAELEQMKEEFTKRIGESEAKLQAAAKERDLFKKQLEETQKCLSSDMERQLKEFQSLLQQKDEQAAQLMEEGEKLSKQILQRNNNVKKLRTKEKELTASNESLSTRLAAAEAEIERLTGILRERDGHEKEQDDAIKKLNAYTKKQEDKIAKQKVELEESAAKLPSLQTALDNAYKEITELHKVNAAKSTEVQAATLSVEMTAKEELRIALEKLKKESQKECEVLAMEVSDMQTQLNRSEQQAARREDNLRQEIEDIQMRLQEAESRNQELTQSVSVATRPLLRQIENLQHSYGSQQTSWEKLERNLTERLADAQTQLATAQEKERASTERSIELSSRVASLESQVGNYRQEKSRIEAEFELEKAKLEALEDYKCREDGKIDALRTMHTKQLETLTIEKNLLEQQLVVERTKYESEHKKLTKLEEQLNERLQKPEDIAESENADLAKDGSRSRNSSSSSVFSLADTVTKSLASGSTAVLEQLRATIRRKEGELVSLQDAVSTLELSRESLTQELASLMNSNDNLSKENKQLRHIGKTFQELQGKYNALLQMYGEKQEETEELKLDLQDIKNMYKAQIQELLSGR